MEKKFAIGQKQFVYTNETTQVQKTGSNNYYLLKAANAKKDSFTIENKSEIRKEFEEIKNQQGIIGKAWDGFKNLFGMKSGSKKVEEIIKKAEKGKITQEQAKEAIEKYKEGQKTSVDVVADVASGILSVLAFTLAVPTGGASLAIGLGLATAVGAGIKVGVKATDALTTGKEYKGKDLLYDTTTGAINGLLGPITNGIGNTVTATIGKQITKTVVKEGAEEVAEQAVKQGIKQTAKNVILNQTVNLTGGTAAQKALAMGAGMAVDGALGGASDNMVRAGLNGENVLKAGVEGAIGGAIMAPIIGGGFNLAGKAGHAINNKITTKIVLPDGIKTKFKQGSIGDCALLSTIDGMMNNPKTAKAFKKSITKTIAGDYNVKIGDQIVRVSKDSLSDEVLSDKTGIRIFEQAYKQLTGDIDGGFAEVVAKQFGLNPVHITQDSITDELLDNLAKNQGDTVLSFGTIVDTDGAIAAEGQRHYFTIKNIDAESKTVTLTSPVDTSKTIELSYDEVKTAGISIDGGSVKELDLPNSNRNINDIEFKGIGRTAVEIQEIPTEERTKLINALSAILKKKVDDIPLDFSLSDEAIKKGTDILAAPGTKEHEILSKLAKECFVNIKSPKEIKTLLLKQYIGLSQTGSKTIILNPSNPVKAERGIGTSNKYIAQWCSEILDLPESSIFDADRLADLQHLINSNRGNRITIMVPDDFSGSGRSLTMNTVQYINQLDIPDDVQIDIVFAPATATTTSKKIFKYFSQGNLKGLEKSKILSSGSDTPDIQILTEFFSKKGENIQFVSSPDIYTIPTIFETEIYKSLSPSEQQAIEILLTCDTCTRKKGEIGKKGLTGYGRDNLGINCTMASFPSNSIDEVTGEFKRKTPNNNLFGAMPYALADGVDPQKIKMPGATLREDSWTKTKNRVIKNIN